MAPRYSLDRYYHAAAEQQAQQHHQVASPISASPIEFKPRLDLWASQSGWGSSTRDLTQNTKEQQVHHRRRVRFASASSLEQTKLYIHASEYTQEEKESCWFTREESKRMRNERNGLVDDMNVNLNQHWGVETSGSHQIHYEIRQAQNAVLDEQDDQLRWDGYLNADILSARYMSYTLSAKDRAIYFGNQYAKEVAAMS